MGKTLDRKVFLKLLLLSAVVIILPLAVYLALNRQELRERAAGSNEVDIKFTPSSGTRPLGASFEIAATVNKLAQRSISVSGVQMTVTAADQFALNSATCQAPFNGLPFVSINGQSMTVMCAISAGATPVALTGTNLTFAKVNLTVKPEAAVGEAGLTFTSTRVTEAGISGQAPDVSTAGGNALYTLIDTASQVELTLEPVQATLPPDVDMKVMLDAGSNSVAFARVVLNFNPAKINLASEISTNPDLSTTVEKTAMAQANATGRAVFVIAAGPGNTQPTGIIELAGFKIKGVSSQVNDTTALSYEIDDMQIVDGAGKALVITASPATFGLNIGTTPEASPTEPVASPTEPVNITPSPTGISPTPPDTNPCTVIATLACYEQWKLEYLGWEGFNTLYADLDKSGQVDLIDYEIWRRAFYL
ncbi:MAG: hypothetical protein UV73_C0013G0033 [Candidatus Gottesmanbacteria bacterium GW2011_GWA2_43_14]|uniref:Cohesin domain-containing protein n=1 Tax=Candidatus Gottesmanbacteria bacterium GW2011_GWA2_43_14 TaxID=1618443 RepID=A0A0G1GAA4_9BACT|nr:MAG: hypothetical protein UV73_C0013G0033 [Candidatus Gottesmanbacteria bacterium GW2011_GWA2_43_14]